MLRSAAALLCLNLALACPGQSGTTATHALQQQIQSITREPAVRRAHWGISVTALDGTPIASLNEGEFFQPASNTKLFTTATAMALLPMNERLHTRVTAVGTSFHNGVLQGGELILRGAGDANLSGRPVPYRPRVAGQTEPPRNELRYIDDLADGIKAAGFRRIEGDIRGDDSLLEYQPYPPDWSLDDLVWYYGAPVNALMIADNSITVTITPGKVITASPRGPQFSTYDAPTITLDPDLPYYQLDTQGLRTTANVGTDIDYDRTPGSRVLHLRGVIAPDAPPQIESISIDDPADYAALALKRALEQRGIPVTGKAYSKHGFPAQPQNNKELEFELTHQVSHQQPLQPATELPDFGGSLPIPASCSTGQALPGHVLCSVADHLSAPLYDDIVVTNKISQNQHAELFLRMLALSLHIGPATTASGAGIVRRFLTENAGIDPHDFYFNDGSGMSGHDLVTPRAITRLLHYATTQPWGDKWKASLPVGGVDGSLRARFPNAPLKDHVFAKTGTLGEARALGGYLDCHSGQTVIFSVMVTDHTPLNNEDGKAMDRIVAAIAAAE